MTAFTSRPTSTPRRQRGVTLIELSVGIIIGLLVSAVALGALMVSRTVSGTVSSSSDIQQQAAYAMRVIGQQIRQAGLVRLSLYPDTIMETPDDGSAAQDFLRPVVLVDEAKRLGTGDLWSTHSVDEQDHNGKSGPRITFINVGDLSEDKEKPVWAGNCLGDTPQGPVYSHFILDGTDLKCSDNKPGTGSGHQPMLRNVADFQMRYLMPVRDPANSTQKIQYIEGHEVETKGGWDSVQGVEVCLTLFGKEPLKALPDDAQYQACDGKKDYSSIPQGERYQRLHLTFRSVFQIRGQGRPTTVQIS